ncbi:DUF6241 domain-containing protein [Bacillus sp. MRMR6]|uniref:DUF6241 domain-containing protein n=1 Tax=Bacillus sp. MRMR6 TaxID=1928617 RepID=UPI000952E93C|nr:DUF6241 domain-containing protein [Bacillus sp. MRMR6]OLS33967.1 hypothetical protein BTR25_23490 [Bacillus sp. MRMR6]
MIKRFGLFKTIIGLSACIVGLYFYLNSGVVQIAGSKKDVSIEKAVAEIEKTFKKETSLLVEFKYGNMGENDLIQEVHNMTHQKVHAEDKWGKSEITAEKIEMLFDLVMETSFSDDETKDMLVKILEPWRKGDFSNALRAHNTLWAYQKGTVGRATRLYTPQEELEYIEKNY